MVSSGLRRTAWMMGLFAVIFTFSASGAVAWAQDETPAAENTETPAPAPAPEAPEAPAAETSAPAVGAMGLPSADVPADLQDSFQQMVHYYRIARFDLASNFAQIIAGANPDPSVLLKLVEAKDVGYSLIAEMAASGNPELSEAARKIKKIAEEGIYIKRKDGTRILAALKQLNNSARAYELAMMELRYSGEYVAPYALGMLSETTISAEQQVVIERALVELDRPVVYPLVVALETPDATLKLKIIELLQQLGYKMALPALKAIVEKTDDDNIKNAATKAIVAIGGQGTLDTAAEKLYYDMTELLYYDKLTVVTDKERPTTDVWGWAPGAGLEYRPAPTAAVNEIMAARAAELGLRADPDALHLVALWMSVQMQMRVDLGADGKNPWAVADVPTTEFFARAIGQQYVMDVLDRALRDDNVLVAIQAIKALEVVANEGYLSAGAGQSGSPLVSALGYPDRLVRFGAAFAIVAAEPHKPFFGADRVVPVLAEAVNLESGPGVLVIDSDQNNLNRLKGEFREAGWNVGDASTGNDGISRARSMSRIDAILIGTGVENVDYVQVIQNLRSDFATALVPIILLSGDAERVPFSYLKENQKYIDQVPANAASGVIMEKIRVLGAKAGAVALNPDVSKAIALRAAKALGLIAMSDLSFTAAAARSSLLQAAQGKNEELAIASMKALAQMPDDEIQQRLADVALAEGASKDIQIAALNAIAQTSRHIGNKLQSASITTLLKRVQTEGDQEIRDAIGTAVGSLGLEAKLASELIREYSITKSPAQVGE